MLAFLYKQRLKLALAILLSSVLLTGCIGAGLQPQGWSGPAISDGILFATSSKGKLVALNPSGRANIWEFTPETPQRSSSPLFGCGAPSTPPMITYGTPVISGGMVYIGTYSGKVYAIDAKNGSQRWEFTTDGPIIGSPAIAGNILVIGSSDGNLYALDAKSGGLLWNEPFSTGGEIWADPLIVDNTVYFGSLDHKLYAVDLKSGQLVWEKEFEGAIASALLIVEDTLYVGSFDGKFYALSAATGNPKWGQPFQAENWFWSKPVFHEGTIYVGSLDHSVYALDARTGGQRWAKQTGGEIRSAAVIAKGVLIIASKDGKVYGLDPNTGRDKWTPRDLGAPILADPWAEEDRVYLITQKNVLYALEADTGFEAWSMEIANSEDNP